MPKYLHPGVYVQEIPSSRTISGVSTSTAAFIGIAEKGPSLGRILSNGRAAQPVMVTSFAECLRQFGGYRPDSFLTYSAKAFFDNGGRCLYIVRVLPPDASIARLVESPLVPSLLIQAANEGAWGNDIWISVGPSSDVVASNFRLTVMVGKTAAEARQNVLEEYDGVTFRSADSVTPNYVAKVVNSRSEYIAFTPTVDVTVRPPDTSVPVQLQGGSDGTTTEVDFIGSPAADKTSTGTGLYALDSIADVSLIAIPGAGDQTTVNRGLRYCKYERPLRDCFFIGDVGTVSSVAEARRDDASTSVRRVSEARAFATSGMDRDAGDHGAIYFPWVWVPDPIGIGSNPRILLPPSGFVAGIYARTDNSRGVWKAPAGQDAHLVGALAPVLDVSGAKQEQLNPVGVNVIRRFPAHGLVVWGARTVGSNPEWKYVNVRRLVIYVEHSIDRSTQWAVFEPNNPRLWGNVRRTAEDFLLVLWKDGALLGDKPQDAFFVRCDRTTMTQNDLDNGRLICVIGIAPTKPAEFVTFRIAQWTADAKF